jgi:hypothetical protein
MTVKPAEDAQMNGHKLRTIADTIAGTLGFGEDVSEVI